MEFLKASKGKCEMENVPDTFGRYIITINVNQQQVYGVQGMLGQLSHVAQRKLLLWISIRGMHMMIVEMDMMTV